MRLALGAVTPRTLEAIDAAILLARGLAADLDCLFVEEAELFRAAALPATREVGAFGATARRFDLADLAAALARQAARAREEVADAALQARIGWSFEVVRGDLISAALQDARASDLLVIGAGGLSLDPTPSRRPRHTTGEPQRQRTGRAVVIAGTTGVSPFEQMLEAAFGHRPARLGSAATGDAAALVQALRQWRSGVLAVERDTLAGLAPELSRSLRRVGGIVVAGPRDGDD